RRAPGQRNPAADRKAAYCCRIRRGSCIRTEGGNRKHCEAELTAMRTVEPEFTIGVEEEYLLVDRESRALIIDPPQSLIGECEERCGGQVTSELLRSQVEVGTKVCSSVQEVRADLAGLRSGIIEVAGRHGLAPAASSAERR